MNKIHFILWLEICILLCVIPIASAQSTTTDDFEVVIQGKKYNSITEYKREQIKDVLIKALSEVNLQKYSDEDLFTILKQIRSEQSKNSLPGRPGQSSVFRSKNLKDDHKSAEKIEVDLQTTQMQEMLNDYQQEHKNTTPITIDPDKVKTIIFDPKN